MKKLSAISPLFLFLSGCFALPISSDDKMTPEQEAKLSGVLDSLVGNYVVVDSRKDDLKMISMTVMRRSNDLMFVVNQKNGENFLLTGKDCRGYASKNKIAVMCQKIPEGLNFIIFDLLDKPQEIKDVNAVFSPFPTMEIKSGDYLIDFNHYGGRPNYYVLKRSTATD